MYNFITVVGDWRAPDVALPEFGGIEEKRELSRADQAALSLAFLPPLSPLLLCIESMPVDLT